MKNDSARRHLLALSIVATFIVGGIAWQIGSKAAGPFVAAEAEQGTITGPAAQVTDTTASGNGAVRFASGSGSSCALPNYPDASCTGVPPGTNLTVVNGDMDITTAGFILENKDVRGCVVVSAPNVIIRKSRIACDERAVFTDSTGLLIEDSEVSCNDKNGAAISWQEYTARRVKVHGCMTGLWAEHNVLVEDSYIYDLVDYDPVTDPHTDGLQIPGGGTNITFRHNTVYGNYVNAEDFGTSAITTGKVVDGGNTNVLIQDNLLAGGGYAIYCTYGGAGNNFRLINNHFSTIFTPKVGGWGPWIDCEDEAQVTGNIYHETRLPVPF